MEMLLKKLFLPIALLYSNKYPSWLLSNWGNTVFNGRRGYIIWYWSAFLANVIENVYRYSWSSL